MTPPKSSSSFYILPKEIADMKLIVKTESSEKKTT